MSTWVRNDVRFSTDSDRTAAAPRWARLGLDGLSGTPDGQRAIPALAEKPPRETRQRVGLLAIPELLDRGFGKPTQYVAGRCGSG